MLASAGSGELSEGRVDGGASDVVCELSASALLLIMCVDLLLYEVY